jgi:hypothetical protein
MSSNPTPGQSLGLVVLAGPMIRRPAAGAGEERWSVGAMTLLVLGATLLAANAGSEVVLAAVVTSGGD